MNDKYPMYNEASKHPAYHFKITARDMARFDLMMLHKGKVIPDSESIFYTIRDASIRMEFVKNSEGIVDTLVIKQLNRTIPAKIIK